MDTLLVKIFATALTLSQVTTAPDALKTKFDPVADQAQVVALLRGGCMHMRKVFEIEDINLDDLVATAMEDPDLVAGGKGLVALHASNLFGFDGPALEPVHQIGRPQALRNLFGRIAAMRCNPLVGAPEIERDDHLAQVENDSLDQVPS